MVAVALTIIHNFVTRYLYLQPLLESMPKYTQIFSLLACIFGPIGGIGLVGMALLPMNVDDVIHKAWEGFLHIPVAGGSILCLWLAMVFHTIAAWRLISLPVKAWEIFIIFWILTNIMLWLFATSIKCLPRFMRGVHYPKEDIKEYSDHTSFHHSVYEWFGVYGIFWYFLPTVIVSFRELCSPPSETESQNEAEADAVGLGV